MDAVLEDFYIDGIRWRSWNGELHYELAVLRVSIRHCFGGDFHSIFGHLGTFLFCFYDTM
ncbi:MAG: hypothetical protein A2V99_01165 [Spirochaetes bacterium RBG_16_67_19]|nr:MAG: hypothetical protein A2064_03280 [Spirochaetes bacterium GWB1_66_5]OHD75402.1 MAG: hypothetical protein A2V99_01165 [Spirochaetes bacterium RBG_16_67_19]